MPNVTISSKHVFVGLSGYRKFKRPALLAGDRNVPEPTGAVASNNVSIFRAWKPAVKVDDDLRPPDNAIVADASRLPHRPQHTAVVGGRRVEGVSEPHQRNRRQQLCGRPCCFLNGIGVVADHIRGLVLLRLLTLRSCPRTLNVRTTLVLRYAEEPGSPASDPGLRRTSDPASPVLGQLLRAITYLTHRTSLRRVGRMVACVFAAREDASDCRTHRRPQRGCVKYVIALLSLLIPSPLRPLLSIDLKPVQRGAVGRR